MDGRKFLTGNQLKLIALIAMTFDHVGAYLFPSARWMRIVGRLAFPIFAYMFAEGCRYTKNKGRHLRIIGGMALMVQLCAYVALGTVRQYILTTFLMSVCICFAVERLNNERSGKNIGILLFGVVGAFFVTEILPMLLPKSLKFSVDYGFCGVMFPVVVFMAQQKKEKLIGAVAMTVAVAVSSGVIQWYSLMAVPLITLYNGKRGKWRIKYFFYAYFPLHLVVIWLVKMIVA